MLAFQLINTTYPTLNFSDKVSFALQLMDDYDIINLPVCNEEKFIGCISKDDLLDADESLLIENLQKNLKLFFVKSNDHFLSIVKIATNKNLSLVPIINDDFEIVGSVSTKEALISINKFVGNELPGAIIVLEIEKKNFSFGEISRLIETNDAFITQLNTYIESSTGHLIATIKINKIEVSDIVSTFQRYEYNILYCFGEEQYTNQLHDNYQQLMTYLNL